MFILVCFTAAGLPSNLKPTFLWFALKASQNKSIWYADDFIVWLCICSSARRQMCVTLSLMYLSQPCLSQHYLHEKNQYRSFSKSLLLKDYKRHMIYPKPFEWQWKASVTFLVWSKWITSLWKNGSFVWTGLHFIEGNLPIQ